MARVTHLNTQARFFLAARVLAAALGLGLLAPAWAVTATITGTSCDAAADPDFEAAFNTALGTAGVDLIVFSCPFAGQTITTTKLIGGLLTIDGDNPAGPGNMGITRLAAGLQPQRSFTVTAAGNLSLKDIAFGGGNASDAVFPGNSGGKIFNSGTVSLLRATLATSPATGDGGLIFNEGTLNLTGSSLAGGSAVRGGGIFNTPTGAVTVSGSVMGANTSTAGFSGAAVHNAGGSVSISKSSIDANTAPATGGSLFNGLGLTTAGQMTITNSTVNGATAPGVLTIGPNASVSIINSTLSPTLAGSSAATADSGALLSLSNTALVAPGSDCVETNGASISAAGFNAAADASCATAVGGSTNFIGVGGVAD
ncbi:MAG: hypothetical protein ACRETN_05625, partial [Nevskiales bacterium]